MILSNLKQLPTIARPDIGGQESKNKKDLYKPDVTIETELKADINAMSAELQSISKISKKAIDGVIDLIKSTNDHDANTNEKKDRDGDAIQAYRQKYNFAKNLKDNEFLEKAIRDQEIDVQNSKKFKESLDRQPITEKDLATSIALIDADFKSALFGSKIDRWQNSKSFFNAMKESLTSIKTYYNLFLNRIKILETYIEETYIDKGEIDKRAIGKKAIDSFKNIINYIEKLLKNLELILQTYTEHESNALVLKGMDAANDGTYIKYIQDLFHLLTSSTKDYSVYLILQIVIGSIARLWSTIPEYGNNQQNNSNKKVSELDMLLAACGLVSFLLNGDLERLCAMIEWTTTKLVTILQLDVTVCKEQSIIWPHVDEIDFKIAATRYSTLPEMDFSKETVAFVSEHLMQKMKIESLETFNLITNLGIEQSDLKNLYRQTIELDKTKTEYKKFNDEMIKKLENDAKEMKSNIEEKLKMPVDNE